LFLSGDYAIALGMNETDWVWSDLMGFTVTAAAGTVPNITAISPQSVTQAQANDGSIYGVYGTNLVSSNASGVVFLDANGKVDSPIRFTVTDQSETLIQGTIALASNVQGGDHSFYVASPNGNSNTLTFTVQGDLTPHIDTVQPTGLAVGQNTQVMISGTNFGTGCGAGGNTACPTAALDVCNSGDTPSCSSSSITVVSIDQWTDTRILATLKATNSGAYEVLVGSAGSTGNGFFAAPKVGGKWSNPQQIVAGGNPNLQLKVTSQTNGGPAVTLTDLSSNLCAYVDTNSKSVNDSHVLVFSLWNDTSSRIAVFRKRDRTWHAVSFPPLAGRVDPVVRGFGRYIAVTEHQRMTAQTARSGGMEEWKKGKREFGPDLAAMSALHGMVLPGRLDLYDVDTEKIFTIVTNQGDSEILLVEGGVVYWRAANRLYSAPITDSGVGARRLLATDEAIRDAHYAFIK